MNLPKPTSSHHREGDAPPPGRPDPGAEVLREFDGDVLVDGALKVVGTVRGAATVPAGSELALTVLGRVLGDVVVAGRADVHGRVRGSVTVHNGGWLNLYGHVDGDVRVEKGASVRISGYVRGKLNGPGSTAAAVSPRAIIVGRRVRRPSR